MILNNEADLATMNAARLIYLVKDQLCRFGRWRPKGCERAGQVVVGSDQDFAVRDTLLSMSRCCGNRGGNSCCNLVIAVSLDILPLECSVKIGTGVVNTSG